MSEETHIPITLYAAMPNGKESSDKLLAMMTRPQDWGDPRWHYEQIKIQHVTAEPGWDGVYVYHLWCDLPYTYKQMMEKFGMVMLTMPMRPGREPELSGRTHLDIDDFWDRKWGVRPPYFERQCDEQWEDVP